MTTPHASPSSASRILVMLYGVISYLIGVAGLVCLIIGFAGLLPYGFLKVSFGGVPPILVNLLLVVLWGLVHSGMARHTFKVQLTRVIPEPAERPTYVLVAGVTSFLLVGLFQPLPGVVWSVSHPLLTPLLWSGFGFGWAYLLAATFAINHFDLFGLRQVYLNFKNQPRPPIQFTKRAMYGFSRHPIQTGVLIGSWVTPEMTATHLTLTLGFTAYIFIGLWFEEKDLVKHIGDRYLKYREEAGMFLPRLSRG